MKLKKHVWNVIGIISAIFLNLFGLWQLDIIVSGPVWSAGWAHLNGKYADMYFQCWLWKTTIGGAYDVLFFLIFLSICVMFVSLWFWEDDK